METPSTLTAISTPDQAVTELFGEQFVTWLVDYTRRETEYFTKNLGQGIVEPDLAHFRRFILQTYAAERAMWNTSDDSPGFLKFAIANLSECQEPVAEHVLSVLEANVSADTWAEAWGRLFTALGLTASDFSRIEPKEVTRNYIAELSEVYSTAEWQQATGSFAAQWMVMPHKFQAIYALAQKTPGLTPRDLEVLKMLSSQETKSQQLAFELLEKISFEQESKELVWQGVSRAMEIEKEFFGSVAKYLEAAE